MGYKYCEVCEKRKGEVTRTCDCPKQTTKEQIVNKIWSGIIVFLAFIVWMGSALFANTIGGDAHVMVMLGGGAFALLMCGFAIAVYNGV